MGAGEDEADTATGAPRKTASVSPTGLIDGAYHSQPEPDPHPLPHDAAGRIRRRTMHVTDLFVLAEEGHLEHVTASRATVESVASDSIERLKSGAMQPPTHWHEQCQLERVARVYTVVEPRRPNKSPGHASSWLPRCREATRRTKRGDCSHLKRA